MRTHLRITTLAMCLALTGCTHWYNAKYKTSADAETNLKLDKAECQGIATSQIPDVEIDDNGRTGGFMSGFNEALAIDASDEQDDLFAACMYRRGWVKSEAEYQRQVTQKAAFRQQVEKQAHDFLASHPEYNDPNKQARLTIELQRVMNDPKNQGLDMAQCLILADENLKKNAVQ